MSTFDPTGEWMAYSHTTAHRHTEDIDGYLKEAGYKEFYYVTNSDGVCSKCGAKPPEGFRPINTS